MRKFKTFCRLLFAHLLSVFCFSCSMLTDSNYSPLANVTALTLGNMQVSIAVGESEYIPVVIKPHDIQNQINLQWEYNEDYLEVDPDSYGVVITGKKTGSTYIKTTVNGITATCLVYIEGEDGTFVGDPYIYSNYSVVEMTPNSIENISVSLYGGQSYDLEDFTWKILNPAIADISTGRNNCVITAKKTGSTQIVASHPKSLYDYSVIVYVYTDNLTECYLTTSSNIVTINKADTASKTVSIDVVNPYSQVHQSGFTWEIINLNGAEPCISFAGNGNQAVITPLKNGLTLLRVTYEEAAYPLDILVRVTTAVQNVYIVPSTTTLIVTGSNIPHNITASITGYSGFVSHEAFEWIVLNETAAAAVMDWEAVGNTFSVTGKKNGAVKVKIQHELSEYSRTVLIVLREQIGSAIDSSMYITTTSNYVQTQIGAQVTHINVSIVGGETGDEKDLVWTIDNGINNDICRIETPTGSIEARAAGSYAYGDLYITPLRIGTVTITVEHPKILYSTEIIIKVYSQYAQLVEPVYITSEANLIRMLNGTTRDLSVTLTGNKSTGDENGITWESASPSVINVSPDTGANVVLQALGGGNHQTYINANHAKASSEKRILVLSADTEEALNAMKGIFADTTYYRINENGNAELELNQFGLSSGDISSIQWTTNHPNICTVNAISGNHLRADISGITSGIADITASLAGSEPCVFHVTVLPEGESTETIKAQYLTTSKNAVNLSGPGQTAVLSVSGVNIDPSVMATSTTWQSEDTNIVTVNGSGASSTVTAAAYGRTRVNVSNAQSSNAIAIDVKVGALYEWSDDAIVYITTEEDVVTLVKGESKVIGAALVNSNVAGGFTFSVTGNTSIIEATGNYAGTCFIEALEAGMSEITIYNANAVAEKQILVVVANSLEELSLFKYLSTEQNVVTIGESFRTTVSVTIKNAASPIFTGYHWTSSNPASVRVVSSGATAVFYGDKTGTSKITVTNDACEYPLEIIANCVDPVLAANNPYITSPNIITLNVGDTATTVTADLVGGKPADYTAFSWNISDSSVAALYASNETAQVRALKAGVAQIVISHPKAGGVDRTILVICEPAVSSNCYITTTESIIRMSPTDASKTITAALVNGTAQDAYNFNWWADDYSIIDMNYSSESAIIRPLSSGMVTIHVSHPKAAFQKDIIIYISQYSEFAFEKNAVSVPVAKQTFVNLQVPTSGIATRISYNVHTPQGGAASNIVSASGTNHVCILDPHMEGSAIVTASLIAVNSGAVQATADLLVSVTPSGVEQTYINFTDSTIINIEKGVTKTLRATLAGLNAVANDSKSLQWRSSDQSVLRISPSSASGIATNDEVQITALKAGYECTITISHEKSDNDVILYVIIPGDDSANITLDRTVVNLIEGDDPFALTAAITNAESGDYNNLVWTITQDENDPSVSLSGSGKKIYILPLKRGEAVVTARVPSSGRVASCAVTIEAPKTLTFSINNVSSYPGYIFTVNYTTSPESEINTVQWTVSDSAYVQVVSDDKNGTLTLIGKNREGIASVTGVTKSKAKGILRVNNGWGNTFSVNKSLIKAVPVPKTDDTFVVKYEVKPSCAELHVWGLQNMILKNGTYDSFADGVYTILPARHEVDPETGIAKGVIEFVPTGESKTNIIIQAWNPIATQSATGDIIPSEIASRQITMNIYYNNYTFVPQIISKNGWYSRYDAPSGSFVVGDGENITFKPVVQEVNGTPQIDTVVFTPQEPTSYEWRDGDLTQKDFVTMSASAGGSYIIQHSRDYGAASGVYHSPNAQTTEAEENTNTTVRAIPLAGVITVKYRLYGVTGIKEYSFPLYIEVRNCGKNYH